MQSGSDATMKPDRACDLPPFPAPLSVTESPLHRIVLTGGPCAGKTLALDFVTKAFQDLDWDVHRVPEAATLLFNAGPAREAGRRDRHAFQSALLALQLQMEDSITRIAQAHRGRRAIILCDRGSMDGAAYTSPEEWQAILDDAGHSLVSLRDARYDGVIHLRTAAHGAEAAYNTANNLVRTESPEQARAADDRVLAAWTGTPKLKVIDNATGFEGKLARVQEAMQNIIGLPEPFECERKFLLSTPPRPEHWPVPHVEVEIEQTYLHSGPGISRRVRRRGQHGTFIHTHTEKRPLSPGVKHEIEKKIEAADYAALLLDADPDRIPVRKRRRLFVWNHHCFELDSFDGPLAGLHVLEVELQHPQEAFTLPDFLNIAREVTDDPTFSNHLLAAAGFTPPML